MLFVAGMVVGYIACAVVLKAKGDWMRSDLAKARKQCKNLEDRVNAFHGWLDKSGL